ncbi:MAG: serine/threonine protein kinase, partial [Rudanella sp.]|nr:serine/threonine protein kinase [Rudanella sp.]
AVMHNPPPPPVLPTNQPLPASLETLLEQLLTKQPAERLHNPDIVKLLLKQAEVEQLHRETGPIQPPAPLRTEIVQRAAPAPAERPIEVAKPTRPAPVNKLIESRPPRRILPIAILVAALGLTGFWAYWYFTQESRLSSNPQSVLGATNPSGTANPDKDDVIETTEITDLTVPPAVRQAENLRQKQEQAEAARQRYEQEVASASNQLEAEAYGGKVGFLGGVKGLTVKLVNPTSVAFKAVKVQVDYVKDNGERFKSETMFFMNLTPNGLMIRKAPDSPRGTQFRARVLRADAAPMPDSLAHSILQNS